MAILVASLLTLAGAAWGPPLAPVPSAPLAEHSFRLADRAEVVATVSATCERCDWGVARREAAVLALALDGVEQQHVVLVQGGTGTYRVLLGALGAGEHRVAARLDARRSAQGAGAVRIEAIEIEAAAPGTPAHEALAHAPILYTRKGALERFSDVPLLSWVETLEAADGGRELRYSVVFSHEDGGTPLDRLMATWGRATDIELVYAVELDPSGGVRRATYQGKDHVVTRFAGRHEGRHPILHVVTSNNMVSDHGPSTTRIALAPVAFQLEGVSREAVMDANPWTYQVAAAEVRREGRVRDDARAGSKRIPDPRRFVFLEACGSLDDARLAFDAGVHGPDGSLAWHASDARRRDFRIARSGCFRAGVALPAGASATDVRALRLRAHTRPARRGERPLPPGSGRARVERVNLFYGIGPDDRPGPSLLCWTEGRDLAPDGLALELSVPAAPQPGSR